MLALVTTVIISCHDASSSSTADSVFVIPSTAVKTNDTDYAINSTEQLRRIRQADPVKDAQRACTVKDYRFIADRFALPRFQGAPDDDLVRRTTKRYGYKIIGLSENLATNREFLDLKSTYEEEFNQTLYQLLKQR